MPDEPPVHPPPDEPPVDPFDNPNLPDQELLRAFVLAVFDDLEALIELREVLFLVASNRTDPDSIRFVRELGQLGEELIERRRALLAEFERPATLKARQEREAALQAHGLTGPAIRVKMAAWRRERAQARRVLSDTDDEVPRARRMLWQQSPPPPFAHLKDTFGPPISMKMPREAGPALRAIERMCGPAATILGSLGDILPGAGFAGECMGILGQFAGNAASDLGA